MNKSKIVVFKKERTRVKKRVSESHAYNPIRDSRETFGESFWREKSH